MKICKQYAIDRYDFKLKKKELITIQSQSTKTG